jgi:hypothetical protein
LIKRTANLLLAAVFIATGLSGQSVRPPTWRIATAEELESVIPKRAAVVSERVETEPESVSGIVDSRGRYMAAAVLITGGYSSDSKYSDYLVTQVPVKIEDTVLPPGRYLLSWTHDAGTLHITLSEASTGKAVVQVSAARNPALHRVEQIRIWPPSPDAMIQLGRFSFHYDIP